MSDDIDVRVSEHANIRCTVRNSATCNQCGAEVVWVRTPKGKNMMCDPEPDEEQLHSCHWDTCVNKKPKQNRYEPSADHPWRKGYQ